MGSTDLEQVYDRIYRYACLRLRDAHLAEDVTQETFLRYINSGKAGGGYEIRYMYVIARNLCADVSRRRRRGPLQGVSDGAGEDATDAALEGIAVRAALEGMADADRELLLLRYVNGESVGTLAALYGCSRFAIYRRLRRAREAFRRSWGGEDV